MFVALQPLYHPKARPSVLRMLKHWTAIGLLNPVDDLHAGTGRPRCYGEMEVYKAAVLIRLVVNYKMPVSVLYFIITWSFDLKTGRTAPHHNRAMEAALADEGPVWLCIAGALQPRISSTQVHGSLFGQICYGDAAGDEALEFAARYGAVHLINLSSVFREVKA